MQHFDMLQLCVIFISRCSQDETVAKLEVLQQRIRIVKTLFRNKEVRGLFWTEACSGE